MMIVLLRYAHVIEKHQNCVLNTASLCTGWICGAGLIMVGNFQVQSFSFFLTIKHREVTVNADEDKDLWIPKEIVFSMGNSEIKHTETEASVV